MKKIIVDASGAILGRMASIVAKELLKGHSVDVINCEKLAVSGSKENFVKRIMQKRNMGRGGSLKGPKYSRREDMLVKRMVRGMLPWEKTTGREAYRRLKCHIGNGNLDVAHIKNPVKFDHSVSGKTFTIKEVITRLT